LLSHIKRTLRLKKLLVGLDEDAFEDPCKYYEAGTDWKKISDDVIPASFMMHWAIEATRNYDWGKLAPAIPMEKIAEEVERQYPGCWQGEFEIGVRGVRFWDSSADNETAAIVRESGMQCFTGGQAFVPWSAILGGKFVRKFEADRVGGAIENIWFDGREYWIKNAEDKWASKNKADMALYLRVNKQLSPVIRRGRTCSDVDKALSRIQEHQSIHAAAISLTIKLLQIFLRRDVFSKQTFTFQTL